MRRCAFLGWVLVCIGGAAWAVPAALPADELTRRVLDAADHRGRPFAIVDKRAATIVVYRGDGTLAGSSAVLLGRSLGDHSVPGVGERTQVRGLRSGDHTTPAGRFASEPGRNHADEPIVWADYANAFSIHRLRPGAARALRSSALRSPNAGERRLSDGCVVVSEEFFDAVVQPLLGRRAGVIYMLPESGDWQALWPALSPIGV